MAYRCPTGSVIESIPPQHRLIVREPNGERVQLGFDPSAIRPDGSIPAYEQFRWDTSGNRIT